MLYGLWYKHQDFNQCYSICNAHSRIVINATELVHFALILHVCSMKHLWRSVCSESDPYNTKPEQNNPAKYFCNAELSHSKIRNQQNEEDRY